MDQPTNAALPPVLLLPALPPTVDAAGQPAGEARPLFARMPEGLLVAHAYTAPERLAAAHGNAQPWVAVPTASLPGVLDRNGIDLLVIDLCAPDAIVVEPDGTVRPLAELAALGGQLRARAPQGSSTGSEGGGGA